MTAACAFCGGDNETGSRFCMDCGKPLAPSAARAIPLHSGAATTAPDRAVRGVGVTTPGAELGVRGPALSPLAASAPVAGPIAGAAAATIGGTLPCPRCTHQVDGSLPYCGACGTRLGANGAAASRACQECGTSCAPDDLFCARCGNRVGSRVSVEAVPVGTLAAFTGRASRAGPRLALLDDDGGVATVFTLERGEAVIGRSGADIQFADDVFMSPLHARLEMREGTLWLRDLGSRNLSWVFVEEPTRLVDGNMMLVGSQVIRFRRLGYPGPYPADADATRRMGSTTPTADVAVLEQLRSDGSVRDVLHLSPGRSVVLGRESGDWLFAYDQTMSGRHVEVRSEDGEFFVHDVGSRNGVAVAVRGERTLRPGQRLLLGDQVLRVESI